MTNTIEIVCCECFRCSGTGAAPSCGDVRASAYTQGGHTLRCDQHQTHNRRATLPDGNHRENLSKCLFSEANSHQVEVEAKAKIFLMIVIFFFDYSIAFGQCKQAFRICSFSLSRMLSLSVNGP